MTQKVSSAIINSINAAKLTGTLPANLTDVTKNASDPTVSTNPSGGDGTVWLNTTTAEMFVCTDSTAGANVWTNVGEGTGDVEPVPLSLASGGTLTTDGLYNVHTFTSSDPLIFSVADAPVEYLVVAGGAGGGGHTGGWGSGGGGAGGYRTATNLSVSAQTYSITVGAGGAVATNGVNSTFSTITSTGGGSGGTPLSSNPYGGTGGSGGSGGGGSGGGGGLGGAASPAGQGNAGGNAVTTVSLQSGGGGGGAGEVGEGNDDKTNTGGDGLANTITGSSVYYSGGGGSGTSSGSSDPINAGGNGGGGAGSSRTALSPAVAGTANLGGGGGGGSTNAHAILNGQPGGSGVVIVRYLAR